MNYSALFFIKSSPNPAITLRMILICLMLASSALKSVAADEASSSSNASPEETGQDSESASLEESAGWFDYFFGDPRAETPPENIESSSQETWYDAARDTVSETIDDSATWFDNFFGDPRSNIDERADASLRVTIDGFYSGVEGESQINVSAKGSVSLPRTENRLRLTFTSDVDATVSGEDAVNTEPAERQSISRDRGGLGLAYLLHENPSNTVTLAAGIKGGPDFYTNARHRYTKPLTETTRLRVTNTLYWITDDGAGVSSLLDLEHSLRTDTIIRYTLFGNFNENTNGLEWSTQASWLRQLDRTTAISTRLGVNGETDNLDSVTQVWATFRYRGNFLRPWLFYEIEPGLSWHEKEDYDTEPTIALRLEMLF